jgi:hypothetical protein
MIKVGVGMIVLAVAVRILASAVKELSDLDWEGLKKGLIGVGGILVALTLFAKFSEADKGGVKQGVGLVLLAAAIKLLVDSVSTLGNMDTGVMIKGIGALGIMLAMLIVVVKAFNNTTGIVKASASMLILAGALMALSLVLRIYAALDYEVMKSGLIRVSLSLAAVAGAMWLMPKDMTRMAASLFVIAKALLILSGVLKVLGSMKPEEIGNSLKALGGSLTIITAAIFALGKVKGGAKAALMLMTIAKALVVLGGVLFMLSKLSGDEIKVGLMGLAGIFTIIVAATWAISPVVEILVAFAAGLKLLGIAMILAGAGSMLFAGALAVLAVTGAAGFAVLYAGIMMILPTIPLLAQQFGLGMVAIAKVLGDAGPVLMVALAKVLISMLKAFVKVIPEAAKAYVALVLAILSSVVKMVPKFIEAGWTIVIAFLKGIADHIQETVVLAYKIVREFIQGIIKGFPDTFNAAKDLLITFIKGLTNKLPDIMKTGADLIVAYLNGIKANLPGIVTAGIGVVVAFLQAISKPENLTKYMTSGKDAIVAYLNGLLQSLPEIITSAAKVVVAVLTALGDPNNYPKMIQAGMLLLAHVITGMAQKMPDVIAAAYTLVTKILEGLGNEEKLVGLVTAGYNLITRVITAFTNPQKLLELTNAAVGLVITVINAIGTKEQLALLSFAGVKLVSRVATAITNSANLLFSAMFLIVIDALHTLSANIRSNGNAMRNAAVDVGASIVEGLVKGMALGPEVIVKAGTNLAGELINAVKNKIKGNSPSKVFMGIGRDSVQGLANGLSDYSSLATKQSENVGHAAINAMRTSIAGMSDLIANDIDTQPTIRPVLDLTSVQKDAGLLGSLLPSQKIGVGASYSKANSASMGYFSNQAGASANTAKTPAAQGTPAPRPVEFHIGTIQDGDSLLRRARANDRMLSLAEGGDSPQMVGLGL